jgi:hypothetical protein
MNIREFMTDGTPGITMAVPSSGPTAVVNSATGVIGGALTLTPSGDKLVFTGFSTVAPAGTSLATTSSAVIPRAVGTVDAQGVFARPATTTYFDGVRMLAVASDGVGYWAGGENSGVQYLGPGPAAGVYTGASTTYALHFSPVSDLYGLMTSGSLKRFGSGPPTVPVVPTDIFQSTALDFQLSPDGQVCYTSTTSSIRKWVLTGSTWTNVYTFSSPGWLVRILVDFRGASPVIYGLHNLPTKLVKFIDQGAPVPETVLATAPANTLWYGIAFTPGTTCGTGSSCDDGDPLTFNDAIGPDCICAGQVEDCAGTPGGSALPGSACDDGNALTGSDTWSAACQCVGQQVLLNLKVILSGALPATGTLMNDQLRSLPSFPLQEPYSGLGLPPTSGPYTIAPTVLATTGLNAIVDWIVVELRSPASTSVVTARRAALLQRDGDVVDLDGISPVAFPVAPGSYHVAVRHRNHLGAMTAGGITLSGSTSVVDLRPLSTSLHGIDAMRNMGSFLALWSGNTSFDGQLSYVGLGNDRDAILLQVGGTTPNNTTTGYNARDVNLNGIVSYTGTGNDRDVLLVNVGSTTPNNLRFEQLP